MNTRDVRVRENFIQERQAIISRLILKNLTFRSPEPAYSWTGAYSVFLIYFTYNEDLHVLVQEDKQKSMDGAVSKVEKLLGRRTEFSPTYRVTGTLQIMQNLCEEGHKSYVCTCQSSYLNSSCCGRNHVSYTFPFMVPTLSNSGGKNSSGSSPSYWSYSQSSIGSTPSTVVSKTHKENDEKNVIHP